jgi:hypothetical protein
MVELDTNRTVYESVKITTDHEPKKYICELPEKEQCVVKLAIVDALIHQIDPWKEQNKFTAALEDGLNGQICDLEDLLEIEYIN